MTDFVSPDPVVQRDGYGRPLIIPPEGGDPVPYTRVSTFAKTIEDQYGLMLWKLRYVAVGFGRREDLAALAATFDPEPDTDEDKAALDLLIDRAFDSVGGHAKADWGTAVHRFTEPGMKAEPPLRMAGDCDAYFEALKAESVTVCSTERFVVNDELRVAGTFDHEYDHPLYGRVIGDKKTGELRWLGFAVQLFCYATGRLYKPLTATEAERGPLLGVSDEVGIVAHIPRGEARCELAPVNLKRGRQLAAMAWDQREARSWDDVRLASLKDMGDLIGDPIIAQLEACSTVDELNAVYYANKARWTDAHKAAGDRIRDRWAGVTV